MWMTARTNHRMFYSLNKEGCMNKFFKGLVKSAHGVSMTKVWGSVVSVSATIVGLAGAHIIDVPKDILGVLIGIGAISGKLTIDAARDALDKVRK
jgi:hypothetical protein